MKKTQHTFVLLFVFGFADFAVAQRPTITSFSPSSGVAGTSVTITGADFAAGVANNIVYFGGMRATVTSVNGGRTQMTVTAPAGATNHAITITANRLTGSSRVPFRLTTPTSFVPQFAVKRLVGQGRQVQSSDLNSDTRLDLITSVVDTNRVDFLGSYRNTSAADVSFAPVGKSPLGIARGPFALAYGDLDGDGLHDVIVGSNDNGYLSVFRNTSTASSVQFVRVMEISLGAPLSEAIIGDLDADGRQEIVLPLYDSSRVLILPNTSSAIGTVSFGTTVRLTMAGRVRSVALGDIDGDGFLDIVAAEPEINQVGVFRKNGSGNFAFFARQGFSMGTMPDKVQLGDFDGDGSPDVAVANAGAVRTITVRRNTSTIGSVTFANAVSFSAGGSFVVSLAIGELNGDGRPDVAVANHNVDSVTTLLNTSSGAGTIAFASPVAYQCGPGPWNVAIADLDKNGRNDLVAAGDRGDYRFSQTVLLESLSPSAALSLNRTSLSFSIPINTTRVDSVIVTNTGGDTLRISSAAVRTTKFQVTPTNATIAPGASRAFRITFIPLTDTTLQRDTVTFLHNAPNTQDMVALNGRGTAPVYSVNRTSLAFTTPLGTPRADSAIVTNTGRDTLRITSVTLGNARYQVTPSSATIAPGASRAFRITFTPTDTTLQRDTLRLVHNAAGSPSLVLLSGRGTAPVYTINRTTVAFTIPVNTAHTDSAIVTNTGSDTLRITSATVSNPRFQATPNAATIAPGASRVFRVTFTPGSDTTLQRDTLRFVHNAGGSPSRVSLVGQGIAPALSLTQTSLSFITQVNTAQTDSIIVSNPGRDTLRISSVSGGNPRFQVTPQGATIAPGGARAFRVTFSPFNDTTLQRDTLRFTHNAAGSPTFVFLSGRGTPLPIALFSLDRTSLTFSTLVNTARTDSVRVTNTGNDTLRIASTQLRNARFQVAPTSGNIAPGSSRIFRVTFAPLTDTTLQRDTLRFFHNATGSPSAVTLTGQGVPIPVAVFSINRNSLAFVTTLNTSQTDSVIVASVGSDTLRITSAAGRNGRFQILPASAVMAPGTIRVFRVSFSPGSDTTLQRDTIRFVHNAAGSPSHVFITGRGVPPAIPTFSINRTSLTFAIPINTLRSDSVVVSNPGTDTLRILSAAGSNFRFQVFPQVAVIAPSASRAFRVTFSPQQDTTLQRDTLRFLHNASGSPHVVSLNGRGLAPQFLVNRTTLAFNIPINTLRTDSVFVSNVGTDTLRIMSAFVRNARFAVAPQAAAVLPGSAHIFRVSFTPQNDTTLQRDTLTFVHNALGSPTIVALSGKGNPIPEAIFSINRNALTFNVPINSSRTDSVLVSNTGTDTLRIFSALVANPRFQAAPSNAIILPGATRAVQVTFNPQADTSLQQDTLRIHHNAAGSPFLVALAGRGIPPSLPYFQPDSSTINFGRVVVNTVRDYAVSIFNPGAEVLRIDSVRSTSPLFRLTVADTATIPPTGSRQFTVRFTPSRVGRENQVMRFYHNAPSRSDAVGMNGTGILPAPTNLRVTDSTSTIGAIRLQWNPLTIQAGFLHYKVYGGTTQHSTTVLDSTVNARPDSVTKVLSGLIVGTRYYFRVTAVDSFRTESAYSNESAVTVFVRAPEVVTGTATFDTLSGRATLRGRVNPFGATTAAWFEYDTIPPSMSSARTTPRQLGNGTTQVVLEDTTSLLLRGRQYHFRLVAQNSFSIPAFGVVQTFSVPQGTVLPPPAPELRVPPDNASVASSVQMTWAQATGASRYHVQAALEPSFSATTFYLINDSTLTDTSRTLPTLAAATSYYWRVGAKNSATQSAIFSPTRRFATERSRFVLSPPLVFPSNPRSERDYRLVSIPGGGATVAELIADAGPTEGVDWRVFRDNGRGDTVGRQHLVPLVTPTTVLTQGEGYWLIRKHSLTIRRNALMTPLDRDGATPIALHDGFNIVANPFELPVSWSALRAKNPGLTNARLYTYVGSGYDTAATLEPFAAYYVFKPAGLNTLRVPFPFFPTSAPPIAAPKDWQVQIEYRTNESEDKLNFIGVAPSATEALDALEHYEAPRAFNHGALYFVRPEWDGAYKLFSDDFRPRLGEGQTWEFEVASPKRAHSTIHFRGLESIPAGCRVVLINRMNTAPIDLRANPLYEFVPTHEKTQFTLIVGTPGFAARAAAAFIPEKFALAQNYPNPFNPTTTISYTVARTSHVRLEIVSALGTHVRTLVNHVQEPASYTTNWDAAADNGAAVATGVYFYRLLAGGNIIETRKMLLLR